MDTQTARERLEMIKDGVREALHRAGRRDTDVRIVGATKFKTAEEILPVVEAGLLEAGENRAQEFNEKFAFFAEHGVKAHFIGALQTNKVKYLVGRARLIQSVDRLPLAEEINRLAVNRGVVQPILIEVNIGGEEQKSGVAPDRLTDLVSIVSAMPGVCIEGLMCVPPASGENEVRRCFARMRELFVRVREQALPGVRMDVLSMGMSGDYKAAILEGSNMVRIGSALFGARQAASSTR